ncbi:hypothetical protein BDN70DRAFT_235578 [Pholiota conissans]|uniref:Uncharacterized protein n=1 Tax=Pholiota conissans TaxID=109636 RepID=A0A9P5ZHS2_9AGAR|nr:hypothetical protein BDN70DRAFT_235578 [Pholiota conissans]
MVVFLPIAPSVYLLYLILCLVRRLYHHLAQFVTVFDLFFLSLFAPPPYHCLMKSTAPRSCLSIPSVISMCCLPASTS